MPNYSLGINIGANITEFNEKLKRVQNILNDVTKSTADKITESTRRIKEGLAALQAGFERIALVVRQVIISVTEKVVNLGKVTIGVAKQIVTGAVSAFKMFGDYALKAIEKVKSGLESLKEFGNEIMQMGIASGVSLGATVYGLKNITDAFGDSESAMTRFKIAFSKDADNLKSWVSDIGDAFGYTTKQVNNAAASAKIMGTNYGMTSEQVQKIVEIAGNRDVLAGGIFGIEDATNRLMAAMRGEAEASEALGLSLSQTAVKNWMMEKGVKGNIETMDLASQAQVRYKMLLDVTKDRLGSTAAMQNSYNFSLSRMTNAFDNLKTSVGAIFAKDFSEAFNKITYWLKVIEIALRDESTQNIVKNIVFIGMKILALGAVMGVVGAAIKTFAGITSAAFSIITNPMFLLIAGIGLMVIEWENFKKALDNLGLENIAKALDEDFTLLANAIKKGNINEAVKAIALIGVDIAWGVISILGKVLESSGIKGLETVTNAINEDFSDLRKAVKNGNINEAANAVGRIAIDIAWGSITILGNVLSAATGTDLSNVKKYLDEDFTALRSAIKEGNITESLKVAGAIAVDIAWGTVKIFGKVLNDITDGLLKPVTDAIDDDFKKLRNAVKNGDISEGIKSTVSIGIDIVWGTVKLFGKILNDITDGLLSPVLSAIDDDFEKLRNSVQKGDLSQTINSAINIGVDIAWAGIRLFGKALEGITKDTVFETAYTQFKNQFDGDMDKLANAIRARDLSETISSSIKISLDIATLIVDSANSAVLKIDEIIKTLTNNLKNAETDTKLIKAFTDLGNKMWELLVNTSKTGWDFSKLIFAGIETGIKGLTNNAELSGALTYFMVSLFSGIGFNKLGIGKAVNTEFEKVSQALKNTNGIKDAFKNLGTQAKSFIKAQNGFVWSLGIGLVITDIMKGDKLDIGTELARILGATLVAGGIAAAGGAAYSGYAFAVTYFIMTKIVPDKSIKGYFADLLNQLDTVNKKSIVIQRTKEGTPEYIKATEDFSNAYKEALDLYQYLAGMRFLPQIIGENNVTALNKIFEIKVDNKDFKGDLKDLSKEISNQYNGLTGSIFGNVKSFQSYIDDKIKTLIDIKNLPGDSWNGVSDKEIDNLIKAVNTNAKDVNINNLVEKVSKIEEILNKQLEYNPFSKPWGLNPSGTGLIDFYKKHATGYIPGFATGAFLDRDSIIHGPGTEKSDSIIARLSRGEAIINAASTRKYRNLLVAINQDKLPLPGYFQGTPPPPGAPVISQTVQANPSDLVKGIADGMKPLNVIADYLKPIFGILEKLEGVILSSIKDEKDKDVVKGLFDSLKTTLTDNPIEEFSKNLESLSTKFKEAEDLLNKPMEDIKSKQAQVESYTGGITYWVKDLYSDISGINFKDPINSVISFYNVVNAWTPKLGEAIGNSFGNIYNVLTGLFGRNLNDDEKKSYVEKNKNSQDGNVQNIIARITKGENVSWSEASNPGKLLENVFKNNAFLKPITDVVSGIGNIFGGVAKLTTVPIFEALPDKKAAVDVKNDALGQIGTGVFQTVFQSIGDLAGLFTTLTASVGMAAAGFLIFEPLIKGILKPLQPVIEKLQKPFEIIGELIGQTLVPILEWCIPIIELLGKVFVWLYNSIILPVGNFIIDWLNFEIGILVSAYNWLNNLWNGQDIDYKGIPKMQEIKMQDYEARIKQETSTNELGGGGRSYSAGGSQTIYNNNQNHYEGIVPLTEDSIKKLLEYIDKYRQEQAQAT